ncbi:hypothetical protein C4J81_13760 [Deltaproteobacteria bacterium Smac51]|nr:hypothetical protein C4J81_13760 [Deltaproteobacteria bacterium Smac51]
MGLIVEDGTMPEGANSYASVSECDTWQTERASTVWPTSPEPGEDAELAKKEAALILASDYLNGLGWNGRRSKGGRVLAWPRIGAVDTDGYLVPPDVVPKAVKSACCYLAGMVFSGSDLQPVMERGGRVQSESVGSLATSFFDDAASRDIYSALADLLRGLASEFDGYAGTGSGAGKKGFYIKRAILA